MAFKPELVGLFSSCYLLRKVSFSHRYSCGHCIIKHTAVECVCYGEIPQTLSRVHARICAECMDQLTENLKINGKASSLESVILEFHAASLNGQNKKKAVLQWQT